MKLTYTNVNGYLIPNLTYKSGEQMVQLGKYGFLRRDYPVSYTHLDVYKRQDVSGYTNPHESEHDFFTIGHTSTSVSLACGLAKARDLKGEDGNVIAVIGDGSLSGGEALDVYKRQELRNVVYIVFTSSKNRK